ncbi:hypothetical protein KE622_19245 [Shewanella algae]|uniref:hypothetical protein n=1 Tax=Shewanella algae TaxID=38313 RepID=UPI0011833111|nr:hypothetical protein [Shewanella algae]MDV2963810.1 hypothetical protein [Shewanella algae]QTE90003.1 hypothetical protein JKK33_16795 [Shewanella algae]QXP19854.1 hypothetical protein KE621_02840 [Shewanella algae]QXP29479.1 hypothetical protein KE622_19245 [Shewanella algae]QXP33527.1 hypothetical protein KE623_17955 [Shewanella algae]
MSLWPGTISLSIHQHGISYLYLLRTLELNWQDISEFHLFNTQRNQLIGYYSDSYLARLAQRSPLRAKTRRVLQSLPANFERPAAEVCELLDRARLQALQRSTTQC